MGFDCKFHGQFRQDFLAEPIDDQGNRVFCGDAALVAVENLILANFGRGGLVLDLRGGVEDVDIGKGACPASTCANVLLPDPLGPIMAWVSPALTARSMPCKISAPSTPACKFRISNMYSFPIVLRFM